MTIIIIPNSTCNSIYEPVPDLACEGELYWEYLKPGSLVKGSFIVINVGDLNSTLDWEIAECPQWGDWTFNPDEGEDLKPEDGPVSVDVELIVPKDPLAEFTGEIRVVNKENQDDYCIILIKLSTSMNTQSAIHPLLKIILDFFQNAFPILRHFLIL